MTDREGLPGDDGRPEDPYADHYPMVPQHPGWDERPATTRRLAVAASVVFAVLAGLLVVVMGWRLLSGALAGDAPEGAGEAADIGELVVGDCYRIDAAAAADSEVAQVKLVPCSEPHSGQVYAVLPLGFDAWPGDEALTEKASTLCEQAQGVLEEAVYDAPDVYPSWFVPLEESWDLDERTVQCVLESGTTDGLTRSYVTGV